jgi:hypothetical protein
VETPFITDAVETIMRITSDNAGSFNIRGISQ